MTITKIKTNLIKTQNLAWFDESIEELICFKIWNYYSSWKSAWWNNNLHIYQATDTLKNYFVGGSMIIGPRNDKFANQPRFRGLFVSLSNAFAQHSTAKSEKKKYRQCNFFIIYLILIWFPLAFNKHAKLFHFGVFNTLVVLFHIDSFTC